MFSSAIRELPRVTVGGPEYASRVADVMTAAFSRDPLTRYLFIEPDSSWPSDTIPRDFLVPHFQKSVSDRAKAGAELAEAGDFAAAALWFPPGIEPPAGVNLDPRIQEARENFSMAKSKHLGDRKYWILSLIGRNPQRTEVGQYNLSEFTGVTRKHTPVTNGRGGVVRALVDHYLNKARADGIPIWLEAISEHGRQVYEHLSFRTVEEMRLGVGKVSSKGEPDERGEGMIVYGMLAE